MKIPKVLPAGYSSTVAFVLVASGDRSIQEIADALQIECESAHTTLFRLVKKGLLKRVYPRQFGRKYLFTLTDAGIEVKEFFKCQEPPKE